MAEFERVLAEYSPALRRLTALYASTSDDREDLMQEIAIALWRALPSFEGRASARTFVFRIAHNRGLSFRSRVRRPLRAATSEGLDGVPDAAPGAQEAMEQRQARERLLDALVALPALQREAIALQLEGLDTQEMCDVLGITANALGVRLHRARERLRAILSPPGAS